MVVEIIHLYHDKIAEVNDEYAVAIGNFDGIHQGHREVIKKAVKLAKKMDLKAGIMCFDITPRQIINKIDNYYVLKSFKQKQEILESLGIEVIFLVHFDDEFKNLDPRDFIEKMIVSNNIKYLICGFDFAFGKDKTGTIKTLEEFSSFQTIILPRLEINNEKISSSLIHELLAYGDIKKANELLVKEYSIIGKVVMGNQKGKAIGFPTANIIPLVNYRILQSGVYATKVLIKGKEYYGMTNIGHNPTFNFSSNTSIETNIFNFDEDIYNEEIEVIFVKYLRRERIFDNVSYLIKQLETDKQAIIDFFKS